MNKIFKIGIGIIGIFTLFLSCDKSELPKPIEEGTYFGTFTVKYSEFADIREGWSSSGTVTLELKGGKYTYNSDIPPKLCSGNYSVSDNNIIFEYDAGPSYPDLYQVPPCFDVKLILAGEYAYTFDGKKLNFSATKDYMGDYKYKLKKQ